MNIKEKFWIGTFISLWVLVSTVSTFHSVEFFGLSNNTFFSWCVAIGFEIGAMASLGGLLISRGNKVIIWGLFIILTLFQIHGNMYFAWTHAGDLTDWTNLFDLVDEDPNFTKRVFSFISGGILPLISLGFIKSLMDYMRPKDDAESEGVNDAVKEEIPNTIIPDNFIGGHGDPESWAQMPDIPGVDEPTIGSTGPTIKLDNTLDIQEELDDVSEKLDDVAENLKGKDLFVESNEKSKQVLNNIELNTKKKLPTKLGEIIEGAEKTVNSIGEK